MKILWVRPSAFADEVEVEERVDQLFKNCMTITLGTKKAMPPMNSLLFFGQKQFDILSVLELGFGLLLTKFITYSHFEPLGACSLAFHLHFTQLITIRLPPTTYLQQQNNLLLTIITSICAMPDQPRLSPARRGTDSLLMHLLRLRRRHLPVSKPCR